MRAAWGVRASEHASVPMPLRSRLRAQLRPTAGEPLMQRADDTEEALGKRLESYHAQTVPILDHYSPAGVVSRVDADKAPDAVWDSVAAALPK